MCLIFSKKARKEYKARKTVLKMDDATIDAKVKIQGTPYDRKRKYGPEILNAIQLEFNNGVKVADIAKKYDMSSTVVRYNVDSEFKKAHNAKRKKGAHGIGPMDFDNRVTYKRKLVKDKKISVAGLVE